MVLGKRKKLQPLPLTSNGKYNQKCRYHKILRILPLLVLALLAFQWMIPPVVSFFQHLEEMVDANNMDPYRRARIFAPIRTFFIAQPSNVVRGFDMRHHTVVINRASDTTRWQAFLQHIPSKHNSSSDWMRRSIAVEGTTNVTRDDVKRFPFVRKAMRESRWGDAGCFLSHVRILDQLVQQQTIEYDYVIVLEDDGIIQWPVLYQQSNPYRLSGPEDAELLQLFTAATKRVDVHNKRNKNHTWTRVLGGHGAVGYLITLSGANKLLHYLERHNMPMDLAFYEAPGLRVYLSNPWPLVKHTPGSISTRRQSNG